MMSLSATTRLLIALALPISTARAETPAAIAAPGETLVATIHAQGAHIYECKADTSGRLVRQFREPIATLIESARRWAVTMRARPGN